jgi:hypothetical protein
MRGLLTLLLVSSAAWGQAADAPKTSQAPAQNSAQTSDTSAQSGDVAGTIEEVHVPQTQEVGQPATPSAAQAAKKPAAAESTAVIPAGSKIPLLLKQAISTKNAREGDAVYAETVFPFVLNEHILVPAGTYIQGKIVHTEPAGRSRKRAEILIHFTSMIYPTGYTVMLPASVENTPGAEDKGVKDSEGTIQQDKDTGQRVEDTVKDAAVAGTAGGLAGAAAGGLNGARIGGGAGLAAGAAWALMKHGPDVKLDVGTSIEMEVQRDIPIDASRIQVAKAQ